MPGRAVNNLVTDAPPPAKATVKDAFVNGLPMKKPACSGLFSIRLAPDLGSNQDLRINGPALYRLSYRGIEALNYSHKSSNPASEPAFPATIERHRAPRSTAVAC